MAIIDGMDGLTSEWQCGDGVRIMKSSYPYRPCAKGAWHGACVRMLGKHNKRSPLYLRACAPGGQSHAREIQLLGT